MRGKIYGYLILISSLEVNVLWKVEYISPLCRVGRRTHFETCHTSLLMPYVTFYLFFQQKQLNQARCSLKFNLVKVKLHDPYSFHELPKAYRELGEQRFSNDMQSHIFVEILSKIHILCSFIFFHHNWLSFTFSFFINV